MRRSNESAAGGNEVEHDLATGPVGQWFRRVFWGSFFVAWCFAGYQGIEYVHRNVDKLMEWIVPAAHSAERSQPFQQADEGEWFRKLNQPDNPTSSCCGASDAYHADEVEPCRKEDGPACWLVAIITDTRPDSFQVSDGKGGTKTISRPHLDVGTRIAVPFNKKRKVPSENPTDHGVIFAAPFSAYDDYGGEGERMPAPGISPANMFTVYCFEPLGGL